jgi:DNA-binding beta-propeller fold protein YncE
VRASVVALGFVAAIQLIMCSVGMAAGGPPLILERTIPLENVSGRIDHMAIDRVGRRLFVAELGNDSVDVVDLQTGKILHRITGLNEPQGVAYLADQDVIVVANRGDGSVRFFHAGDLSSLGTIALGNDADNVRIDPSSGHVFVGYGNGGLAIIDPVTRSVLADIRLAGHPESFQLDPKTDRVFANVPDAGQIAVVDPKSHEQVGAWTTPGLAANFPMALDSTGGRLAIVFRNPAKLALLDAATGAVTATLDTCGDADDVFFDGKRDRIYVSCGNGAIDVVQLSSAGFRPAGRVATASGARTSLFVPELDRLLVAVRARGIGSGAAILVFRPSPLRRSGSDGTD